MTIYILYAAKIETDGEEGRSTQPAIGNPKPGESVRSTLGTFVTSLGKPLFSRIVFSSCINICNRFLGEHIENAQMCFICLSVQVFYCWLHVVLGPGASFGEVALISEDTVRTASIIVDEPSDFILIDRNLYNRWVVTFYSDRSTKI